MALYPLSLKWDNFLALFCIVLFVNADICNGEPCCDPRTLKLLTTNRKNKIGRKQEGIGRGKIFYIYVIQILGGAVCWASDGNDITANFLWLCNFGKQEDYILNISATMSFSFRWPWTKNMLKGFGICWKMLFRRFKRKITVGWVSKSCTGDLFSIQAVLLIYYHYIFALLLLYYAGSKFLFAVRSGTCVVLGSLMA